MLDPPEPVMRQVPAEWPRIKAPRMTEILRGHGHAGSVELVRLRLRAMRPPEPAPRRRTGDAPGQVAQLDWAEMQSRPQVAGRERRVDALVLALPYSGAQTTWFSFDMSVESFLEGHVRAFDRLGGVPAECVYDNLRAAVARRRGPEVEWAERFAHLRGHYAFSAHACAPGAAWHKGAVEAAVRYLKSGFWPARRFCDLPDLQAQYGSRRDEVANVRIHATGRFSVAERLAAERAALRPLAPVGFDPAGARPTRVPADGYLTLAGAFYRAPTELVHQRVELRFSRDEVWIVSRGAEVARYPRSYQAGTWHPAPIPRPAPPPPPAPAELAPMRVAPPELAPYAELGR